MTEATFKQALAQIKENDCKLPAEGETYADYAALMLEKIGDTDAEFRDAVNYEVFCQWVSEDAFTEAELCEFLDICLDDEHLMFNLGEGETNNVFTRTFSALFIAVILEKNNETHFISSERLHEAKAGIIKYYGTEKDLRGYDENYGWAHAAAHGADVIACLMQCPEMDKRDIEELLAVLPKVYEQNDYVFIEREHERISVCVRNALERGLLTDAEISAWVMNFDEDYSLVMDIGALHRYANKQHFLKTLYFALKSHGLEGAWLKTIEDCISTL